MSKYAGTRPQHPVREDMGVRVASLAGDRVDGLHVLGAEVVELLAAIPTSSFSRIPGRSARYSSS